MNDKDLPAGHELMSARSVRAQEGRQRHRPRGGQALIPALHALRGDDGIIDPSEWDGVEVPRREWIVPDLIPSGCTTMLNGDGGKGKSHIAMQLMISGATGSLWMGRQVSRVPSLGVFCEDDPGELQRRMADILNDEHRRFSDLKHWVTLLGRLGRDNLMYTADRVDDMGQVTSFLHQVKNTAIALGARLIVMDSLYNFFGGNENNRPQANQFINAVSGMAMDIDGAVVLLGHPSMSGMANGTGSSGSTAWHNSVRSRLYLHHRKLRPGEEPDQYGNGPLVLKSMKSNYGAAPAEIQLERRGSRFVPYGSADEVSANTGGVIYQVPEPGQEAFDLGEE